MSKSWLERSAACRYLPLISTSSRSSMRGGLKNAGNAIHRIRGPVGLSTADSSLGDGRDVRQASNVVTVEYSRVEYAKP
ncbi:hypothetical protein DTO021D3_5640 [Paecilomyces variotii]|nr:hypothetical protein DTO032I3_5178 [Paecilomyces variotii]KAJ9277589.1 hypothetical protein DTO021D3_5640 [Paecilomyces variotii]KAJ9290660.1 hypothetical protein DTO021C3_1594 [Paecilomyces variotii]KAJ9342610.1 hypothetical protein DTO027B6_4934 [Paecilomyces variotii]KAJ9353807.1 hypothetical protein DTO027B9_5020 [Paecilomyces variotii]